MASEILAEKGEIASLVREKGQIESKLAAAGGQDFSFLLEDCGELSGIIDEIDEVLGKKDAKEHAAYESKIKFMRKIRRKTKDLREFEQRIVREYDGKHLSLEHGRKMASIIKLLRSKSLDKARREAAEFYGFLDMGARLEIVDELLSKKRMQVERAKRAISSQLSGLEWLEKEPQPDLEKAARHEEWLRLGRRLGEIRMECLQALRGMPLVELLKKIRAERLGELGFPKISEHEAGALSSYLEKSNLGAKSCASLLELMAQNPQKLRHLQIDSAAFRQNMAISANFLEQVKALHLSNFLAVDSGQNALNYLSGHGEEAKNAIARLSELGKTLQEDGEEWERTKMIGQKKAELGGLEKSGLQKSMQELQELENILDGKAEAAKVPPAQEKIAETKKEKGLLDSILGFFKSK